LILVVEDDPDAYAALARELECAGYRAAWARHGDEALRLMDELRPAAVTLDLMMPGADGWQVLTAIKSQPATADTPVVIVSQVADQELALTLGADDYFTQPVDRGRFLSRLQELIPKPDGNECGAVLVIDDDPEVHEILEESLSEAGYTMMSASSGPEGLAHAVAHPIAAIVLDLMMPEMNGFEVAEALQRDQRTRGIPILVLTASDPSQEDRDRLSGKISSLMQKGPDHPSRLLDVLDSATGRVRPDRL
jgi:CheY-like chemotaxis protein